MTFFRPQNPAPLPPGPRGLPLVGNVLDMPTENEWLTFSEWGRRYGGICSVTLLGQTIVIINSADIMEELDKRGSIYSDRPRLVMGGELLIGTPNATSRFHPLVGAEMHAFLKRVAADPNDLSQHLRKTSGAIIMKIAYGIEVREKNDPFVELIEQANDNFNIASKAGAFWVDVFPALRHIPAGFPGGGFHELAGKWAKAFNDMVEIPYSHAKQLMASGTAPISFVTTSLEQEEELSPEDIFEIKHTAASLYGGGADTTVSAQHAFFLAMVRHPEVMKKAQAEIDAIIGHDRLPGFGDREQLPYVNAVTTEALRWNSVAPTGVPHRAMEDGIIGGYFLPKGAIIVTNLWNMLHDPEVYPDPFDFDPERYIPSEGKTVQRDPRHACFGYARRICAGMHLAEASLWLCIVMSLSVFDITPALDEHGQPIIPEHENTSGTISHPKPFKCSIKPRSEKAFSLISAEIAK